MLFSDFEWELADWFILMEGWMKLEQTSFGTMTFHNSVVHGCQVATNSQKNNIKIELTRVLLRCYFVEIQSVLADSAQKKLNRQNAI